MANSEILINNIKNVLANMEKESNIEESMIVQGMNPNAVNSLKKKYQEDTLKEIYEAIQKDDEQIQQLINPEMMNKYVKNFLIKMEQDSNNQEDMILHRMKPNIENIIQQRGLSKFSN